MKNLIKSILITLICLFFITTLHAQQTIRQGTFTIAGNSYKISNSLLTRTYLIENTDKSELKPNLLEANGIPTEIIRTRITNVEELQKTVCEALGEEKRAQLVASKEKINGWIYYRSDGTVISIMFKVHEDTKLTLEDLVRIEHTLQQRFKASFESDPPNFHQFLYHISIGYEWDFGK